MQLLRRRPKLKVGSLKLEVQLDQSLAAGRSQLKVLVGQSQLEVVADQILGLQFQGMATGRRLEQQA